MNKLSSVSAAVAALVSTSAYAENTVFFNQTDEGGGNTVGIGTLTIEQTGTAKNRVGTSSTDGSLVEGALGTLTIKQLNSALVSTSNEADIALYGSDGSTTGSLVATFDGSENVYVLNVGADGDTNRYENPSIAVAVTGNDNTVTDNLANGGASGDTLNYAGTITGNDNAVNTSSSVGVESVDVNYDISGSSNTVTVAMANAVGDRDIDLALTGSNNNWTLNAQSATSSKIDLTQTGAYVTGTIGQTGIESSMTMALNKAGVDNFTVNTTASGSNQQANIGLVALGGGSFTLNQVGTGAIYSANHAVAAGGLAVVNQ
jgi:hypothetical protein